MRHRAVAEAPCLRCHRDPCTAHHCTKHVTSCHASHHEPPPTKPTTLLPPPHHPQVKDQTWTGGNLALKQSHEKGTPVRVARQKPGPKGERLYVYEGLYHVKQATYVPSKDGPHVCRWGAVCVCVWGGHGPAYAA